MEEMIEDIAKLVDRQEVCFINFIDKNGYPTARTMLNPRKRVGIREFYLTTNTQSDKVQALLRDPKAGLYFYDRPLYRGVAFAGTVEVVYDQALKDEIWRDMDTIFYDNNTDPNFCVLKFTAISARYYRDYRSIDIVL